MHICSEVGITSYIKTFFRKNRTVKNLLILLLTLSATIGAAVLLSNIDDDNNPFAMAVFILAVVIVARWTDGFLWGILAALIGTFCLNYMFTYPFWSFSMDYKGYPLTFSVMLIVSLTISALTTQIKRQERLRYEMEREKMYSNLLRAIAHDLRTPLASIIGAGSSIREQNLSAENCRQLADGIQKDAQWLLRVTENLLSITRFSSDIALKKEEQVLEEIIGDAIGKYRRIPESLPIEVDTLSEIILVPMDEMLIEQVLVNLFDNVHAHAEGAGKIWIHIKKAEGFICISVEDDGCGISPALLPRILEDACLSKCSGTDSHRNMGIGLSVCRSIIEAHGGKMFAGNSRHGGAAIGFTLPCGEEIYAE